MQDVAADGSFRLGGLGKLLAQRVDIGGIVLRALEGEFCAVYLEGQQLILELEGKRIVSLDGAELIVPPCQVGQLVKQVQHGGAVLVEQQERFVLRKAQCFKIKLLAVLRDGFERVIARCVLSFFFAASRCREQKA